MKHIPVSVGAVLLVACQAKMPVESISNEELPVIRQQINQQEPEPIGNFETTTQPLPEEQDNQDFAFAQSARGEGEQETLSSKVSPQPSPSPVQSLW